MVVTESIQDLIRRQANCRDGLLDPTSASCIDTDNRLIRNAANGALTGAIVKPINEDSLKREGIDVRVFYNVDTEDFGSFNFMLSHSHVLNFELVRYNGEDPVDLVYGEPRVNTAAKTNTSFNLGWNNALSGDKSVSVSLFVTRIGSTMNFDHSQMLDPYYNVNLSTSYRFNANANVSFSINNVFNAMPKLNGSGVWPNYWADQASPLGRSAFLTLSYTFN